MTEDIIVKTTARLMTPFIQMFGLYIILHGHLTPGGGFQGGAIIGASMILLAVVYGLEEGEKRMSHDLSTVLESSTIVYVLIGFIGIAAGVNFLASGAAGIPLGRPGSLLSGGMIFALNIVIGFKVASTGKTLFYTLAKEDEG
ncbi:MAG TPA: sodium:proton antiporter [Euryarchaeota archaeon]|nr:sodium:proton antiporter [Euryarchaeota archaeon]